MSEPTPKQIEARKTNPLKHGVLSKELIDRNMTRRDRFEFTRFADQMVRELNPQGMVEQMYVDRIIADNWRLKKLLRAEVGEIKKRQDVVAINKQLTEIDPKHDLEEAKKSIEGVKALIRILTLALESAEEGTILGFRDLEPLRKYYYGTDQGSIYNNAAMLDELAEDNPTRMFPKAIFKVEAKREKERLERRLALLEQRVPLETEAEVLAASVPEKEVLEVFTRYRRSLEKSIDRALNQLIRIQAMRMGQKLLPSIAVDIEIEQNS